jgi:site-specific DNA-methyltransferase (adenine-specific)
MEVLNIDCLDCLSIAEPNSFDLIIADPPYFRISGDFDFIWSDLDAYLDWCKKWIRGCHRVLKNTGTFYLWGAIGYNRGYALPKLADWIESEGLFVVRNWITQRNTRGVGMKRGYMCAREELVYMTKTDDYTWNTAYTLEKSNRTDLGADGKPRKNKYKRCSDVWCDIAEASQSSKERFKTLGGAFPTVKALRLCQRIIEASSNEGDRVFIPFGGSGSEALACFLMKRDFLVTEINTDYVNELILPRLELAKIEDGD